MDAVHPGSDCCKCILLPVGLREYSILVSVEVEEPVKSDLCSDAVASPPHLLGVLADLPPRDDTALVHVRQALFAAPREALFLICACPEDLVLTIPVVIELVSVDGHLVKGGISVIISVCEVENRVTQGVVNFAEIVLG